MEQKEGNPQDQDRLLEPFNYDPHQDIIAANTALSTVLDYDEALLPEDEKEMVREIRNMAIRIVYIGLREIYFTNFYGEEENP